MDAAGAATRCCGPGARKLVKPPGVDVWDGKKHRKTIVKPQEHGKNQNETIGKWENHIGKPEENGCLMVV